MRPARGTIVILTSDFGDYAEAVVDAVSAVADKAGFGTLCVAGGELAPDSEVRTDRAVSNGIYRLIERVNVAGLICESGLLGHRAGPAAVTRFLKRYHMPCVSLGLDVRDTPSVVTDDKHGMTSLMEHLVSDTPCRRFAFVRGVDGDQYSEEREAIFRDVLGARGLEVDEALFVSGNYDMFEAYDVVARLLRSDRDVDAIVAANDAMALSAARAATAAGLRIPRDIVVSGFDDVPDATRFAPALTTVRQPLVEMAEAGIAKLLALIDAASHEATPIDVMPAVVAPALSPSRRLLCVSSELVVRGSTASSVLRAGPEERHDAAWLHGLLAAGMSGLKAPGEADLKTLAVALHHTLEHDSNRLAEHLSLGTVEFGQTDAHWWSNLCHQIETLAFRHRSAHDRPTCPPLVVAALVPVRERIWASNMEREFAARRLERMRSRMQLQIGSATGSDEILSAIDHWILAFGPQRFFLVRYDAPAARPRAKGYLIRAVLAGASEPVANGVLDTCNVLPPTFADELNRGTLLLSPVYAGTDHFGYLLIDPEGLDVSQTDSGARSIGNAMRSQFLIEALESQASRLRDANVELSTLANRDALTGLANRLCFERKLRELCDRGHDGERFVLCFLDLDGFKAINDTLGHEMGDELLQRVATRLERVVSEIVGERGFVARLGGDEFTALVSSRELEKDLERLVPALLETLSGTRLPGGVMPRVSGSIGGAVFPDHGRDSSTLLKFADAAMYEAKSQGKNGFVLYRENGGGATLRGRPRESERDDDTESAGRESGRESGEACVSPRRRSA